MNSVALSEFYRPDGPKDVVGYLRGSTDVKVWRRMIETRTEQMIILGSVPPTDAQWAAAGVANRGEVQTIRFDDLRTFIITFGGFMVSRPWGKISTLSTEVLQNYGITITQFQAALSKRRNARAAVIKVMNDIIDSIEREANRVSGQHKIQAGLTTGSKGDFIGFFGFWTNHLFNSDVPPITIWNPCFGEIAHARSTMKEGKLGEAVKSILQARSELGKATGIYFRWESGIEFAGTKMQLAIGAVAVALILSAAAATVATAVTAGTAAAEGTAAVQTVEGVTSLITKADQLLLRVVTTPAGGVTAPAAVAYEQALQEAANGAEQMRQMVR